MMSPITSAGRFCFGGLLRIYHRVYFDAVDDRVFFHISPHSLEQIADDRFIVDRVHGVEGQIRCDVANCLSIWPAICRASEPLP